VFLRLVAAPATDHDGSAAQLRVAQELDRRIERVHVEMRDETWRGRRAIEDVFVAVHARQCTDRETGVTPRGATP